MKSSGLIWYFAGVVSTLLVLNDWVLPTLSFVVDAIANAAEFLGGVGTGILLAITAVAFMMLSRNWAENKRAKWDMNRTWNQRKDYR